MKHPKSVNSSTPLGSSARPPPPLGYPLVEHCSNPPNGNSLATKPSCIIVTAYPVGTDPLACPVPGFPGEDPYPPGCPPMGEEEDGVYILSPPPCVTLYGRVSVVNDKYIASSNVYLNVDEDLNSAGYTVKDDAAGNLMFQVRNKFMSLHKCRTIHDDQGNCIINMHKKDLLFKVCKTHVIQYRTNLHVFLKGNDTEEVCDFRVEGGSSMSSCAVYVKDTEHAIARMQTNDRKLFGVDSFSVTVYPNVDQAFITALIVLLDEIN